jgi:hypothetical protein
MPAVMVGGAVANKYLNGGEAWVRLSWVLGLQRLGFDVTFVEQIAAASCIGPDGEQAEFEQSANRAYFDSVMQRFGLSGCSALVLEGGERTSGLAWQELLERAEAADLLVNISGHVDVDGLMSRLRRKAYVDLDPGFTQFWQAGGVPGTRLEGHDVYFTVGANVGTGASTIPSAGIDWQPVRPPVVLDEWPAAPAEDPGRFTTIATWRSGFGTVEFEGRSYGLKVHEFRKVLELPRRAPGRFEIALDIHPGDSADLEKLNDNGWSIVDPCEVASDPDAFRAYVQGSGAEFSVAQGVYVDTASGWFSDRTAAYLASGKPALVQDTGLDAGYPVGEGLVTFRTLEEAVAGAERIGADRSAHGEAARALAESHFDSAKVLPDFLARAGVS